MVSVAPELRKLGAPTPAINPHDLAVRLSRSIKSPVAIANEVNRVCHTKLTGANIAQIIGGR